MRYPDSTQKAFNAAGGVARGDDLSQRIQQESLRSVRWATFAGRKAMQWAISACR